MKRKYLCWSESKYKTNVCIAFPLQWYRQITLNAYKTESYLFWMEKNLGVFWDKEIYLWTQLCWSKRYLKCTNTHHLLNRQCCHMYLKTLNISEVYGVLIQDLLKKLLATSFTRTTMNIFQELSCKSPALSICDRQLSSNELALCSATKQSTQPALSHPQHQHTLCQQSAVPRQFSSQKAGLISMMQQD